MSPAVLKMR